MKKHVNIPVFIPHLGCPNQCVFCNQRTITGREEFDPESVKGIIDEALSTIPCGVEVEIAFFGGSFTGIDSTLMCKLLEIAYSYITSGRVQSIRCSTRPDYINADIIKVLKQYGVKCVELGLQSVNDGVLDISKRGHTSLDAENACRMIVESGIDLVGQMMIGLPGSSIETERETAEFLIKSGAVAARIYPTVVFKDTELYYMAECGEYKPLEIDDAISRSAEIFEMLTDAGLQVIRIGLCASENLSAPETYFAGPNHPALGELVENEYYYKKIYKYLSDSKVNDARVIVSVKSGSLSKAIGQNRRNKVRLVSAFPSCDFVFKEDIDIEAYGIKVEIKERKNKCT